MKPLPFPERRVPTLPATAKGFVSNRAANNWEEGLLCGNGTLAINALSRPDRERIIFSHERLFMPMGAPTVPRDQSAQLPEIRRLIAEGNYQEAAALQFRGSGQKSFMYPDFYVPAFDLVIEQPPHGAIHDYSRSVNFESGEATVGWTDDVGRFERRMFVSRKHGVAVVLLTTTLPESLDCQIHLESREASDEFNDDSDIAKRSDVMFREHFGDIRSFSHGSFLGYQSRCLKAYPGSIQRIEGRTRVVAIGGSQQTTDDGAIRISGANRVLLISDIRLPREADYPPCLELEENLEKIPTDYEFLLDEHIKIHATIFKRVSIDLGGNPADHGRPVEELIEQSSFGHINMALVEKQFHAGRYNILCSTGELPPTLQGKWGGTYVPGWASDFTHNGNLQAAIAANLMGNMPELMEAYTKYIESLLPDLKLNAAHFFGARGIVLPSRTTTHGYNNALADNFAGGMWVAGAPWAARFFHDYYLYTGDLGFLEQHALPLMEQTALFFEDYLTMAPDGTYLFSPGTSPENTPGNTDSQASFNATMDVAAIKELLQNLIAASRLVGRNDDKIPVWEDMISKMPAYAVSREGRIKEWLAPQLDNHDDHRHSSQLYPLYDGLPNEIAANPEIREAFKNTILHKLERHWKNNPKGFMSFGLVQLGQASASLGEAEMALDCIKHLSTRFWLNNLASTHNHRALFNMDISGGMPAVIIKMLVDSAPGKIRFLPALPAEWETGSVEGLLCRGAVSIQRLSWNGKQVRAVIRSAESQRLLLECPSPMSEILVNGVHLKVSPDHEPAQCQLEMDGGKVMSLDISLA